MSDEAASYTSGMDLKQLEYFVRVAELGGFTRASIALNIAQPALSRQVRQLEVELGLTLLVRNGRGVTPTESGKLLLEHARTILHQVVRAREELGRVRGELAGRVEIGLPPRYAKRLTVSLSRLVRERLPHATLSITEGLSTTLHDALVQGRLDIALLYHPPPSTDIDSVTLLEEEMCFVIRKDANTQVRTSITRRELAEQAVVIPTWPHPFRLLLESTLSDLGLRPRLALEVDSIVSILDLVVDGAGAAVLPINAVTTSGRADVLHWVPVVDPPLSSKLVLAVSAKR